MPKARFNGPESEREIVLESGPVLIPKGGEFDCTAQERDNLVSQGAFSAVKGKPTASPKVDPALEPPAELNVPPAPESPVLGEEK